ncbi:MAG: sugar phosphate isomerase/epimerase [Lunatimonas sp.]|uniref:sugar phosphate isomerase/epimerase family protein n=1 Tax=Lunatimonas sp. TaxID=2060141 RepID=UPI00263B4A56|nr:sugar phosphate isomerase/epimerase [Lunatimonas sp.]MCC5938830.1 sugar phosphate isomerase/epimerase [Lunatimonas sp.]
MNGEKSIGLGIFSKTFSGSPDVIFQKAKLLGFDGLHYNMVSSGLPALPPAVAPFKVDEILLAKGRYPLDLLGLSATFNLIHPDQSDREAGFASLEVLSKIASELEITMVTLCTGTRDPQDIWKWHPDNQSKEAWIDLLSMLERCILVAEKHGIKLGIEPEFGNVVNDATSAKRLLDELQSPMVSIIFDPANLFEKAKSPEEVRDKIDQGLDLLGDQVGVAHLKDKGQSGVYTSLGKGIIDFPFFLKKLSEIDFSGPLVIHGITEDQIPESLTYLHPLLEDIRK